MHRLPDSFRRHRMRAVRPAVVIALLAAACDGGLFEEPIAGPQALLQATFHRVQVDVTNPNAQPAPNIVVTATNVGTGDYTLALTNASGRAVLEIPDGSYLVHARNLQSAGPAVPRPLSIAPLPNSAGLLPTSGTQSVNRLGVLWDPNAPGGVVPLDPANYSRLTVSPPLVLGGAPSSPLIGLQFLAGTSLNCTFFDGNGRPINLPTTENIFVVLPHGAGPLPPVPAFLAGFNFPRGILLGVATVPAGQRACSLAGFNQGPTGAVLETNTVPIGGQSNVFVGLVPPAGGPTPANIPLIAGPQLASTNYLLDPTGDARGPEDLGLITSGWTLLEGGGATDDFHVMARFRGLGSYMLDLRFLHPENGQKLRIRATVLCNIERCALSNVSPSHLAGLVSARGVIVGRPQGDGAVFWTVRLPGVSFVEFNILAGANPLSDVAPNTGAVAVHKDDGSGNSWIIPGD